jgi:hypothetical protein
MYIGLNRHSRSVVLGLNGLVKRLPLSKLDETTRDGGRSDLLLSTAKGMLEGAASLLLTTSILRSGQLFFPRNGQDCR